MWSVDLTKVTSNGGRDEAEILVRDLPVFIAASFTQEIRLRRKQKKNVCAFTLTNIYECVHTHREIHTKNRNMNVREGWGSERFTRGRGSTQERGGQGFAEAP